MSRPQYGGLHQALRRQLLPGAIGSLCVRCGRPIQAGQPIDLDHTDDGRGWSGFAHAFCNRSAGGRKGAAALRMKRRITLKTVAVEISYDRLHTSVCAAGHTSDGRVGVEVLGYLGGSDTARDVASLVSRYSDVTEVVVDGRSPGATLIGPLEAAGVMVRQPSPTEVAIAHGIWVDELRAGRLRYRQHPALDDAMQHADVRPLAGGEAVKRRSSEVDVSPLAAAQLAVWALLNAPPFPAIYL